MYMEIARKDMKYNAMWCVSAMLAFIAICSQKGHGVYYEGRYIGRIPDIRLS